MESSSSNIYAGNNLSINVYGVYVDNSYNNRIYMNNLINNNNHVLLELHELRNSTEPLSYTYNGVTYRRYVGNYWSAYFGPDPFGYGLGEQAPDRIWEGEDYNPLKRTSEGTPSGAEAPSARGYRPGHQPGMDPVSPGKEKVGLRKTGPERRKRYRGRDWQ